MGANATFVAIFAAIFVAVFLPLFLSGERSTAAQESARVRRIAEARMNARLLETQYLDAFLKALLKIFPLTESSRLCASRCMSERKRHLAKIPISLIDRSMSVIPVPSGKFPVRVSSLR